MAQTLQAKASGPALAFGTVIDGAVADIGGLSTWLDIVAHAFTLQARARSSEEQFIHSTLSAGKTHLVLFQAGYKREPDSLVRVEVDGTVLHPVHAALHGAMLAARSCLNGNTF